MSKKIPFNVPYTTGDEIKLIKQVIRSHHIGGSGEYTRRCQTYLSNKYGFKKALLTTSCTDALEMSALLTNIQPGDEVIVPSYTFVSSVNPVIMRGAKIVFADSETNTPNIDATKLESLITKKTKAIIVVHYAGVACDMDPILALAQKYHLSIIEDAAHSTDSYYKNKALGTLGDLGTFSFHETKNITCGEGGLLVINKDKYIDRAEIIWEKGTNRASFLRGEINKYSWVDVGSSFLPSEILAAYLWSQIQNLTKIQKMRKKIWNIYYDGLADLHKNGDIRLPHLPEYATNNAHLFYFVCENLKTRNNLIQYFRTKNIAIAFHYQALHISPFYKKKYKGERLENAERYSDRLLRLPLYPTLSAQEQTRIILELHKYFKGK